MLNFARPFTTRWPLLLGFVVFLIVLRQLYTSSGNARYYLSSWSQGKDADNAYNKPKMFMGDPSVPTAPNWQELANNRNPIVYNPYPKYNSSAWRAKWKGYHALCVGPTGGVVNDNPDDMIMAYEREEEAPAPMIGSFEETGLDTRFVFEQTARMAPYGLRESASGIGASKEKTSPEDESHETSFWENVRWGHLQQQCITDNRLRYQPIDMPKHKTFRWREDADYDEADNVLVTSSNDTISLEGEDRKMPYRWWRKNRTEYKKKSAVVLRTYDGLDWTPETIQHIRSYIMELSLHSGGEYEIIILSEVKNPKDRIFDDEEAYNQVLLGAAPSEFRDMLVLFNEELLKQWYPLVKDDHDEHSQTAHMHQPMQLLSLLRPDIEFFWQAELDIRYTGHHYQLFEASRDWSAAQPRRLLWERNSQYYFPAVHGNWADYGAWVSRTFPGSGVWGPVHTTGIKPIGPTPPFPNPEDDKHYSWGVGEEADFLILAPVFDITNTSTNNFLFSNGRRNYPDGSSTPARATATVPLTRFSKRLLRAMHHGQITRGFDMMPEMYPESTCLQHGLKLVSFPLPVYVDTTTASAKELESEWSKNQGMTLLDVPYNKEYQRTWRRMTYWHSMDREVNYAMELWARWTRRKVTVEGGQTQLVDVEVQEGEEKERLCLPGILIHPVKHE